MTLAPRVAVAVAPVPIPLPVPTLKPLEALVLKGFSTIAWQTILAPDYRSGLNICYSLATTSGGRHRIVFAGSPRLQKQEVRSEAACNLPAS